MKVAVMGRWLDAGLGRYTLNLTKSLAGEHPGDQFLFLTLREHRNVDLPELPNLSIRPAAFSTRTRIGRGFWEQVAVPRELRSAGCDVYHTPLLLPHRMPCVQIVTVHDVALKALPWTRGWWDRTYMSRSLDRAVRGADHIIAVSEATKNDILRYYRVREERISVVHEGVDSDFFTPDPIADESLIRRKYGLKQRYIFSLSTLHPAKNFATLVKAFASLASGSGVEHQLVIGGRKGWLYDEIFKAADGAGLGDRLIFTDYIDDHDLPAVYRGAEVFVYPSLYEGFGLPVLEAMACGTPVVTSNTTSLPEVAGDAAILVDPEDTGALARAIFSLVGDDAARRELKARGVARARSFSWAETARRTFEVYRIAMDTAP